MLNHVSRFTMAAAISIAAVLALSATANAAQFETAFRSPDGAFLVTAIGEVYTLRANEPLRKAFTFSQNGRSYVFAKTPAGVARWKSQWFVSDGSPRLLRFDDKGSFAGFTDAPVRASALAVAGDALWLVNPLAANEGEQLWRSTDGKSFTAVSTAMAAKPAQFDTPASNLLLIAGSRTGDVYTSRIIGPPVVRRTFPLSSRMTIHTAYSRSKGRTMLEELAGRIDDISRFSLPVRDLFPLERGELATLRNREDVPGADGRLELLLGRRADRYDAAGKHVATAVLPASAHWIIAATPASVTAVDKQGRVVTASWGKPLPGTIHGK